MSGERGQENQRDDFDCALFWEKYFPNEAKM